jgi:hypothetical protein
MYCVVARKTLASQRWVLGCQALFPIGTASSSAAVSRVASYSFAIVAVSGALYSTLTAGAMDTPVFNCIFRQLCAPSRRCLRSRSFPSLQKPSREQQCRTYALRRSQDDGQGGSRWQQRIDAFPRDMSKQLREYPKLTASDLRHRTQRPRRVRMLARDFIEGWNFTT